jgi:hypothetical protein
MGKDHGGNTLLMIKTMGEMPLLRNKIKKDKKRLTM